MAGGRYVIVVTGMLGAGCTEVAEILSRKLGIDYINSEKIIRVLASERGMTFRDLADAAKSGEIHLDEAVASVVEDYVNEGKVIVEGRSGFFALSLPVDLKVFLWAKKEDRVRMVAERRRLPMEEAEAEVEFSDAERKNLVRKLYRRDWLDADLYDLVLNTSKWSYEEAADIIMYVYNRRVNNG